MHECYRSSVYISGSLLLDVLHISISRRFPEGQSGPFGSNNGHMISADSDRAITSGLPTIREITRHKRFSRYESRSSADFPEEDFWGIRGDSTSVGAASNDNVAQSWAISKLVLAMFVQ